MRFFNRRGYTIDQTILIVAIIAILITLVIITLGWTLLSRTSGSKLGSFTDQISQATNVYYGNVHTFPTSMADLDGQGLLKFRKDSSNNFYHDIGGATGTITLAQATGINETSYSIGTGTNNTYLVATFTSVPVSEANEALKVVNGGTTNKGHIVAMSASTACTQATMAAKAGVAATAVGTVCFIAQKVS